MSLLRNARYQSAIQTYTAYGVRQVNSNLKELQESSEKLTQINQEQLEIQHKIAQIGISQLGVSSDLLEESKKQTELAMIQEERTRLYRQEDMIKEKAKEEKDSFIKLQKNLAFNLHDALEDIKEEDLSCIEKAYFFRQTKKLIDNIDYSDFELSDKKFVRDIWREAKTIGKEIESGLSDQDIKDLDIIERIEHFDENEALMEVKNEVEMLKSMANFFRIEQEIINALNILEKKIKDHEGIDDDDKTYYQIPEGWFEALNSEKKYWAALKEHFKSINDKIKDILKRHKK